MSSYWSMYVVPEHWTLRDCMTVAYSYRIKALMSKEEFKEYMDYDRKVSNDRYDELIKQPCLYEYASNDGGDPDFKEIMHIVPTSGRLFKFSERAYELIPELKKFIEDHKGKRYICMN